MRFVYLKDITAMKFYSVCTSNVYRSDKMSVFAETVICPAVPKALLK